MVLSFFSFFKCSIYLWFVGPNCEFGQMRVRWKMADSSEWKTSSLRISSEVGILYLSSRSPFKQKGQCQGHSWQDQVPSSWYCFFRSGPFSSNLEEPWLCFVKSKRAEKAKRTSGMIFHWEQATIFSYNNRPGQCHLCSNEGWMFPM